MAGQSEHVPVVLSPFSIALNSSEFNALAGWPFADPYVARLLQSDIPRRVKFGNCQIWGYREPKGILVGFGTIDVSDDWREFTAGKLHTYIPLLAVNPTVKSLGYGTGIVKHLIAEAVLRTMSQDCYPVLFLDVYSTNTKAIDLYTKCGFQEIATPEPFTDPLEDGKEYIVMSYSVSLP